MPEAVWTDGLESQERRFDEQSEAWLAYVKKVHADEDFSFLQSLVPTTEQLPRITAVIRELTPDIVARCTDRRWSDQELQGHIRNVAYFLQRFDEIIRPYQHSETVERPWFLRTDNPLFWQHLEFGKLYRETTTEQRHNFSDQLAELRRFIADYLGKPDLHYPYLDWLVLDTVTACSLVECMEILMERKHGIAYEFCGANPLKLMLFKSVWHAFFWPLKWVAPAVLAWWTAQYSLTWTLVVGGFYYAVNLILLLLWIIGKVQLALSGKPSLETSSTSSSRLMARYLVLCCTQRLSAPLSSVSPPREQPGIRRPWLSSTASRQTHLRFGEMAKLQYQLVGFVHGGATGPL